MFHRDICRILYFYFVGFSLLLALPLLLSAYFEFIAPHTHPQPHTTGVFFFSLCICLAFAGLLRFLSSGSTGHLYRREALVAVVAIWLFTPAVAGLPFYLSGTLKNPVHAYFEATSGFSTTGATTLQAKKFDPATGREIQYTKEICGYQGGEYNYFGTIEPVRDPQTGAIQQEGLEAVSRALLFWRSFTQWLGGMGIVVLFVAILPMLGVGGKVLFQAEVPGPVKDSLTPRIKETALQLWKIYLFFSFAEILTLMYTNPEISLYDAFVITFSTMSTGGFSHRTNSISAWENSTTEYVIIAFMLIASINFSLYFFALKGKLYKFFDLEFILYLIFLFLFSSLILWSILGTPNQQLDGTTDPPFQLASGARAAIFQLVSAMTTTGFATVDYDVWPYSAQVVLLFSMFVGGMSGSTAGGMKVIRQYILFKIGQFKVESIFRPQNVRDFHLLHGSVDESAASMVLVYFLIIISMTAVATLLFIFDGIDPQTALSLSTLMINNIGIGFHMAAPTESCACFSNFSLILSSLLMIFGRLEFFAVLAVLVPAFWRHSK